MVNFDQIPGASGAAPIATPQASLYDSPLLLQAAGGPMTSVRSAAEYHQRAIKLWLIAIAGLLFVMVLVGGATRLTESGLSIAEWQPVAGTMPPLSAAGWQAEFEKYRATPQYRHLNRLSEGKRSLPMAENNNLTKFFLLGSIYSCKNSS